MSLGFSLIEGDVEVTDGKVAIVPLEVPSTATEVVLAADSPLIVSSTSTNDSSAIPNTKTFTLTLAGGGSQDADKQAAVLEFYWVKPSPLTEKLITRLYRNGTSIFATYKTTKTRDGTTMTSDGTHILRVKRRSLTGGSIEIDGELRGYYE